MLRAANGLAREGKLANDSARLSDPKLVGFQWHVLPQRAVGKTRFRLVTGGACRMGSGVGCGPRVPSPQSPPHSPRPTPTERTQRWCLLGNCAPDILTRKGKACIKSLF